MLTTERAISLQFSNRPLAERIISEMRQRGLASNYKIDLAEADILYNSMEFGQALSIYERLLNSSEAKADELKQMNLLHCLCNIHDVLLGTHEGMECINRLMKIAQHAGNKIPPLHSLLKQTGRHDIRPERAGGLLCP